MHSLFTVDEIIKNTISVQILILSHNVFLICLSYKYQMCPIKYRVQQANFLFASAMDMCKKVVSLPHPVQLNNFFCHTYTGLRSVQWRAVPAHLLNSASNFYLQFPICTIILYHSFIHSFINPVDQKYIDTGHVIQLNTITEINSSHYATILLDILHFIHYMLYYVLYHYTIPI
jgi:hypothetical protein